MDRRSFIRTGVFSAAGIGLANENLLKLLHNTAHPNSWIGRFARILHAEHLASPKFLSSADHTLLEETDRYFAQRGYQQENNRFYYCSESDACFFYPLYLRNSHAGLIDILLPVYRRNSNGNWQLAATLTGFELEAMIHVADNITDPEIDLRALLMPEIAATKRDNKEDHRISTQLGSIAVRTRLTALSASTEINVTTATATIFSGSFISRHNLTCS